MPSPTGPSLATLPRDFTAGLVVFLVALPLCLGVALASGAPLLSGVLSGIVGGILVGTLSGSHTSISGPAAGMTAIVAAQIVLLGSFPAFLSAVVLAGLIQMGLGLARAGFVAAFIPSSVIKGLLAAIGVILILKQIPHIFGHDLDPEGDMAFQQPDRENTFSELVRTIVDIHPGVAVIGLVSIAVLVAWSKWKALKNSAVPAPLIVVLLGVGGSLLFRQLGGDWVIEPSHLVQVPVADSLTEFLGFLQWPDFSQWSNPAVYTAAATIAVVASLETLLSLEAIDKIDPQQRTSPPSRELLAQGIGNVAAGLIGGLPLTSVIVRSSVNINAGGKTKLAAVVHGGLLLVSVVVPARVAERDSALLSGGDPVGHGDQTGQPGAGEADVERGTVSVHPLRGDDYGHRLDRPPDRDSDRAGGEYRLHPQQQHAPPDAPLRGEAPGRRRVAHRTGQPGELPESCRSV